MIVALSLLLISLFFAKLLFKPLGSHSLELFVSKVLPRLR